VPLTDAQRQRKLAEERRELAVELATMDTWKERQKRRFSSVYSGKSKVAQDDEVPPPPPPLEDDENNNTPIATTSSNPWAGFEAMLFSRFGPTAADEEALHGAAAIRRAREKLEAMRSAGSDISHREREEDSITSNPGGDSTKKSAASNPPYQDEEGGSVGEDGGGSMDYSNTTEDASNDDCLAVALMTSTTSGDPSLIGGAFAVFAGIAPSW
jgi:hypothetical protein